MCVRTTGRRQHVVGHFGLLGWVDGVGVLCGSPWQLPSGLVWLNLAPLGDSTHSKIAIWFSKFVGIDLKNLTKLYQYIHCLNQIDQSQTI